MPSTPVTPGRANATHRRISRSARSAIASGSAPARSAPRAGWSAAMISASRLAQQGRGRVRAAASSAIVLRVAGPRLGDLTQRPQRFGAATRGIQDRLHLGGGRHRRPNRTAGDATIAPAAFANRIMRSVSQPDSRPWHSAPPNASPAPSPFTTSTGCRRHLDRARAVRPPARPPGPASPPRAGLPCPATRSRPRAARGRRPRCRTRRGCRPSPSRVASACRTQRRAPPRGSPEHRPVVQVEHGDRSPAAGPQRGQRRRPARLLGTARSPSPRGSRPRGPRPGPVRAAWITRSGAFGKR